MRSAALVLCLVAVLAARPAAAQSEAEFVWVKAPLADALYELAEATGLELVFALRLVEDVRVTGSYRATDDPDRALRLILRDSGVRAERIREGQYVLIKEPLNVRPDIETAREAYTGTLDGRVVGAESGDPLVGAHVWLVDLGLGDVVGPDGGFAVPDLPTGRYVVRVSHVGYRPVRIELDVFPDSPRLPPTIRLQPDLLESTDARVVAGPEPPGPTPGSTDLSALGARQAAAIPYALGEADLAATLSWLPGLSRTGGASGAIVVRGSDPHRTRYVRDGVPLYEPWHAFGLFSAFQPEALSRVRFYRGSLPAALGGGLAAVLDVETTDALAGDTLRTLGAGLIAVRAVADVPVGERVGVHVGLRRSTLGLLVAPGLRTEGGALVLDPAGGRPFEGDRPEVSFADAAVKVSTRLASSARLDVSATGGQDAVRLGTIAGQPGLDYRWRTHTASARLRALQGEKTFVTAVAYRSGHAATERRLGTGRAEQTLVEHGATLDLDHFRSTTLQLQGGLQVADRSVDGAAAPGGEGRQRTAEGAAYLAATIRPAPDWQIQPGLRVEAHTADNAVTALDLSPRVFVRYERGDRLVVRAGLSRQTQAVHRVRDRVEGRYALAASRWLLADAAVPVARSWQAGLGAEVAATDRLALSVDLYAHRSSGLLEPSDGPAQEAGVDPSALLAGHPAHDGRAAGIEAAARLDIGPWTLGASGALALAQVRPETGGDWRPSAYSRPLALGLIAQRARGPWTAAVRLDAESGLAVPGGTRDRIGLRASAAVGLRGERAGYRWTALAQATARPPTGTSSAPFDPDLPLATDARGLPGWPVVSVAVRW
ncbi:TonB-dependent receptor domain-containing protein [Rubrivirga sp. IMCC45206]|uniref:TonB-dependent receptor n=1 Tax=Rubrivirga sp. IMCC45206 TaxID=3391614 RepID=UPI0039902DF9